MSLPVVMTGVAEAELAEAVEWYDQRASLGTTLVAEVRSVLTQIGLNPEMHGIAHRGIRRALVRRFPYSVLYRVFPDRVEVLAVFHNRRDPTRWQCRV